MQIWSDSCAATFEKDLRFIKPLGKGKSYELSMSTQLASERTVYAANLKLADRGEESIRRRGDDAAEKKKIGEWKEREHEKQRRQ